MIQSQSHSEAQRLYCPTRSLKCCKGELAACSFGMVSHVSSMPDKRRILTKLNNFEMKPPQDPPHTVFTCLWVRHHQYTLHSFTAKCLIARAVHRLQKYVFTNKELGFVK